MMHDVSMVARTNNLPEADLVDFAIARDAKYKIEMVNGIARISTWFVENLITDFERFYFEEVQLHFDKVLGDKSFSIPELQGDGITDAKIMEMAEAMKPFDAGCEYDGKVVS